MDRCTIDEFTLKQVNDREDYNDFALNEYLPSIYIENASIKIDGISIFTGLERLSKED